jgi:7-cyano-7-deazaguanine synthase
MSGAVVLFSGGQDSTTCLYWAKARYNKVVAVSVCYGQRHVREIQAARDICTLAGVEHVILDVPALGQLGDSALLTQNPVEGSGGLPDITMPEGLPTSYVPGRNILLLTLAACVAIKYGFGAVVSGVCQTDYSGYPDCRREFVDSLEQTFSSGLPSSCSVQIVTPLMYLTKAETVRLARNLPGCWEALALSHTCYLGRESACGECPACTLRAKGFAEAEEIDPAL